MTRQLQPAALSRFQCTHISFASITCRRVAFDLPAFRLSQTEKRPGAFDKYCLNSR
jgi:hypothetical protein